MTQKRYWLIEARKARGLSRVQIAQRFNIDVTYVEKIENGRRRPRFELAFNIAGFLNLNWQMFYIEKPDKAKRLQCGRNGEY